MKIDYAELGITKVSQTHHKASHGDLPLPANFNSREIVGHWAKGEAGVQHSMGVEEVPGGWRVPGWSVWKDPETGKTCEKVLGSGKFFLMFRPKRVQTARNVLFANVSTRRINGELDGESVAGDSVSDRGMITNSTLSRLEGEQIQKFPETREENPAATVDAVVESQTTQQIIPKVKR